MRKTLPRPKERPGTQLDLVDREVPEAPVSAIQHIGEIGPFTYKAWDVDKPYLEPYLRAVIWKDGKRLRATEQRGPRTVTTATHTFADLEHLRSFLLLKTRKERVPSSSGVPEHPQWEKRLRKRRERREAERKAYDVETEQVGQKTRCRLK